MYGNTNAELFFIISSVGFVVLWIFVAVLLYYLIRASRTFERIIGKAEEDINNIGDTTKEMLEDVRDSYVYNLIFRKKKRNKKNGKQE